MLLALYNSQEVTLYQLSNYPSTTVFSDYFQLFTIMPNIVCVLSRVRLFATPWTVTHQAPLSMGFFFLRQEYWSGLPFLPPGDLPDPGMEAMFPTCPALAAEFFTTSAAWKAQYLILQ